MASVRRVNADMERTRLAIRSVAPWTNLGPLQKKTGFRGLTW